MFNIKSVEIDFDRYNRNNMVLNGYIRWSHYNDYFYIDRNRISINNGRLISAHNINYTRPYIFTKNSIIVNNYTPSVEEFIYLLTIKERYTNIKKVHVYISPSNVSQLLYKNFNKAFLYLYRKGYDVEKRFPTIVTNIYSMIPHLIDEMGGCNKVKITKDLRVMTYPIRIVYNNICINEYTEFDMSNKYYKQVIRIYPSATTKFIDNEFYGLYIIETVKKKMKYKKENNNEENR